MHRSSFALLVSLVLATACADDEAVPAATDSADTEAVASGGGLCMPGEELSCTCSNGFPGVRTCLPSGAETTPCACGSDPDPTGETTGDVPPEGMVLVPGGVFSMGCNADLDPRECTAFPWELPAHDVELDDFWIHETEVSQGDYEACVGAGACAAQDFVACAGDGDPLSPAADLPAICVDWTQARTYCEWAGFRLPTEAEWEKAARGTTGQLYPWGNDEPSCDFVQLPECVFSTDGPEPVGSHPAGASPYGALNMASNVSEWTNDRYSPRYYAASPGSNPSGDAHGVTRVRRGGSWAGGPSITSERRWFVRDSTAAFVGFRCALPDGALPVCGDGMVDNGETCDDGNDLDDDGCRTDCEASGAGDLDLEFFDGTLVDRVALGDGRGALVGRGPVQLEGDNALFAVDRPDGTTTVSTQGASSQDDYLAAAAFDGQDVYAVGTAANVGSGNDMLLRRYSTDERLIEAGNEVLWELQLDPSGGAADEASDVAVEDDGTIIVAGWTLTTGEGFNAWIARVDPDATPGSEVVWSTVYNNPNDGTDRAHAVALTPVGGAVVAGFTTEADHRRRWVARLDESGTMIWSRILNTENSSSIDFAPEAFNDIAVDADGAIYVVGSVLEADAEVPPMGGLIATDFYLAKLDGTGDTVWEQTLDNPASAPNTSSDVGWGLHISSSRLLAVGKEGSGDATYPLIVAYDLDGQLVWQSTPTFNFVARAITVGSDGSTVAVGPESPGDGRSRVVTMVR